MLRGELENLTPVRGEKHVVDHEEHVAAPERCGLKAAGEVGRTTYRQFDELDAEPGTGSFDRVHGDGWPSIARVPEHRDAGDGRNRLLEELEPLDARFFRLKTQPWDVPARTRKAGHEVRLHGIGNARDDDGDRRSGILGGVSCGSIDRYDDVNPEADKLVGHGCKPFVSTSGVPRLDGEGLAFHITPILQPLPELLHHSWRIDVRGENANAIGLRRPLSLGGDGSRENGKDQGNQGKDSDCPTGLCFPTCQSHCWPLCGEVNVILLCAANATLTGRGERMRACGPVERVVRRPSTFTHAVSLAMRARLPQGLAA